MAFFFGSVSTQLAAESCAGHIHVLTAGVHFTVLAKQLGLSFLPAAAVVPFVMIVFFLVSNIYIDRLKNMIRRNKEGRTVNADVMWLCNVLAAVLDPNVDNRSDTNTDASLNTVISGGLHNGQQDHIITPQSMLSVWDTTVPTLEGLFSSDVRWGLALLNNSPPALPPRHRSHQQGMGNESLQTAPTLNDRSASFSDEKHELVQMFMKYSMPDIRGAALLLRVLEREVAFNVFYARDDHGEVFRQAHDWAIGAANRALALIAAVNPEVYWKTVAVQVARPQPPPAAGNELRDYVMNNIQYLSDDINGLVSAIYRWYDSHLEGECEEAVAFAHSAKNHARQIRCWN
eukprot:jgi/Botrbrau1/1663/Bobra.116_2s0007.1